MWGMTRLAIFEYGEKQSRALERKRPFTAGFICPECKIQRGLSPLLLEKYSVTIRITWN